MICYHCQGNRTQVKSTMCRICCWSVMKKNVSCHHDVILGEIHVNEKREAKKKKKRRNCTNIVDAHIPSSSAEVKRDHSMDARRILLLALVCIVSIVAQRDRKRTCLHNLVINGTNLITGHRKHILVVGIINLGNASARTQANR